MHGSLRSLAASLLVLGCTRLKDDANPPPFAMEGGAGKADAGRCHLASPPLRPEPAEEEPGDLDLVFATKNLDFGDQSGPLGTEPALQVLGYDLDGRCTGPGEEGSCTEPPWATGDHADGRDGRDNAVGLTFYQLLRGLTSLTAIFGVQLAGQLTIVIRIRGYNGGQNDSQVEVDAYGGTLYDSVDSGVEPKPAWDGSDRWRVGSAWLETPEGASARYDVDRPKYRDRDAYVRDGVLVARFSPVLLGDAVIPAGPLYGAIVSGRVTRGDTGLWEIDDGVIAGRWRMVDLLRVLSYLADSTSHQTLCAGSDAFTRVKEVFCPLSDISVEGDGPSFTCDGMSSAFGFVAGGAALSGVIQSDARSNLGCTPENDPLTHGCGVE